MARPPIPHASPIFDGLGRGQRDLDERVWSSGPAPEPEDLDEEEPQQERMTPAAPQ